MIISLYAKPLLKSSYPVLRQIMNILATHCTRIYVYKPFYESIRQEMALPSNFSSTSGKEVEKGSDYVFTLGGDGTFLDAIAVVKDSGIPMFGINVGRLGFLSNVNIQSLEQAIVDIKNKNYVIEKRMLLQVEPKLEDSNNWALNDVCIQRCNSLGLISIYVYINDEFLNTYWCDGLIIATPTGSTAYSLGCGGPILMPNADVIVLTPIASHMLTVRPLVVPASSIIKIKVDSRSEKYALTCDSKAYELNQSVDLTVFKGDFCMNLIRLPQHTFYKTLREKLMWGLDKRN
ncbi:MAG: NAD kinase [Bacteroidales bacterium]|nr:NAD kinase [Bacteroidales bacterium]